MVVVYTFPFMTQQHEQASKRVSEWRVEVFQSFFVKTQTKSEVCQVIRE